MIESAMSDNADDNDRRPAFLSKERAESIPYRGADETPQFDTELPEIIDAKPSLGIIDRYREIARLHALGKTNNQICALLGYTPAWLSTVLNNAFIQSEIERYRRNLFEQDVADKLKEASRDGANFVHRVILDERERTALRLDAAKWVNEKTYGKARQEVSVESGTLTNFMEMLKQMQGRGDTLDVTPTSSQPSELKAESEDNWTTWIDQNIK